MSRSVFGLLALCLCSIRGGSSSSVPCTKRIYVIRHGEKIYHADDPMRTVFECLNQKGWARAYNLKSLFGHGGPLDTPDAIFSANYADELNVTGGTVAGKNCRDANGWQRTTQLIAPLSQDAPGGLNISFDNTTGFMPQLCGQRIAPLRLCKLAASFPKLVSEDGGCCPYGLVAEGVSAAEKAKLGVCCNPQAAAAIKAKLAEPEICTVLVAWESDNIEYLSTALGVPGDKGKWVFNEDQFDRYYKIEYDANLDFRSFTIGMQGFGKESTRDPWLGPKQGCGAIVPQTHQGLPHLGVGAAHVALLARHGA